MGRTIFFFQALLSENWQGRIIQSATIDGQLIDGITRAETYVHDYPKIVKQLYSGNEILSALAFDIYNRTYFNHDEMVKRKGTDSVTEHFKYVKYTDTIDTFFTKMLDLCSEVVTCDIAGNKKYLHDLYGLTLMDLLSMDRRYIELISKHINKLREAELPPPTPPTPK